MSLGVYTSVPASQKKSINNPKTQADNKSKPKSSTQPNKTESLFETKPVSDTQLPDVVQSFPEDEEFASDTPSGDSYILNNSEQLESLIEQSQIYFEDMDIDKLERCKNHLDNIKFTKNSDIDIQDPETIKTFLAFKKLVKYEGNPPVKDDGRIDEETALLGVYYRNYKDFQSLADSNADFGKLMNNLYNTIYCGNLYDKNKYNLQLIPNDLAEQANILADEIAEQEGEKYGCDINSLYINLDKNEGITNVTQVYVEDNEWNDWKVKIYLDENGYGYGDNFTPKGVVLMHELYHAKQTKPGSKQEQGEYLMEVGPTLQRLVLSDEIYKKLKNIDINDTVEYPAITTTNGKELNIGNLVNVLRQTMAENGYETYEETLMDSKITEFLSEYFM